LSEEEFKKWMVSYKAALSDLNNREELVSKCVNELEQDMELLGVTGVEGN
jgi:uncharacterized HAD superfamily protein